MKIGVFDSGLGGLFTLSALRKTLPEYDFVYLGDTKRLPYGSKSPEAIYSFLKEGVDFLFSKKCSLIIVACNTASAEVLRKLQQEYIPSHYPGKNALGMIVPLSEAASGFSRVGLVATTATIASGAYSREFAKRAPKTILFSLATPLIVPFIEQGEISLMRPALEEYLRFFSNKKIEALILGCTHYGIAKKEFKKLLPKDTVIISQDTVVPKKTKEYLARHPEIEGKLSRNGEVALYVTDSTPEYKKLALRWFGKDGIIKKTAIEKSGD